MYFVHLAPARITARFAPPVLVRHLNSPERPIMQHGLLRYVGFFPNPNYIDGLNRHNSLGFRGKEIVLPKPSGEFRIACLGGSTTYCAGVEDPQQTYPARLEHELQSRGYSATVINAGGCLYTSYESLINYALRYSYLDLDMIIIYHGINDMIARIVWPPAAFKSDNSGFRPPYGSKADFPLIFHRLCLLWTVPNMFGASLEADPWDCLAENARFQEWYEWKMGGAQGIFKDVTLQEILNTNRPVFFERNLKHLVDMANGDHIRVVLVTFVHDRLCAKQPFVSADEIQQGYEEMNDVVRRVAAQTKSPLFDAAREYPVNERYLCGDGIHFNEEGTALHAHLIADFLDAQGVIPEAHQISFPAGQASESPK